MVGKIDHIEIEASNAEEMANFLKKLGYEESRTTEHHGESFELEPTDADGPLFEIHTVEGEEVPGINHIAYAHDDLDALADDLEEQDVDSIVGPYDVPETGRTILNFRDPDGRRFQAVSVEDDE